MDAFIIKKSSIEGRGIFAARSIKKNSVIFLVAGPVIHYLFEPDYRIGSNWLQVAANTWKMPLKGNPWHCINHSCDPNAGLLGENQVVAMRDIKRGEEITIDYAITEGSRRWRMNCRCGAPGCRRVIRSVRFLARPVFEKYKRFVPAYLRHAYFAEKTYVGKRRTLRLLLAKHKLKKNEKICVIEGPEIQYDFAPDYRIGYRWLAIGKNAWIIPLRNSPWAVIRHSCDPNAGIVGKNTLVAMRAIEPDEELTVDDSATEADPRWHRTCHCGSKKCRKNIRSVQFLSKKLFVQYRPYMSSFIKQAYLSWKKLHRG